MPAESVRPIIATNEVKLMRQGIMIALLFVLAACGGGRESESLGGFFDPYCAEDGSVVQVGIANSKGKYEKLPASRENCPWNKKKAAKE
jgi:hypothetical protein